MATYKYLPSEMAEALRRCGLSVRRPVYGPQEGLHRSPHYGASVEFAEYREYAPGDPTNLIDWAVYARSDRYVIRRYHEETNLRAYVMLDVSSSLDFQDEGPMSKLDYASFLAAGMMFVLRNQGDHVSLATFDRRILSWSDLVGTSEGLRPLLLSLEDLRPAGEGDIEAAIHDAAETMHAKSLVVLISDLLQDADKLVRGMRRLHHDGHNAIVLHVVDKGERHLSFGGMAEMMDLETRERMVVEVDEIREAYEAAMDRHIETLRRGCTECLADYYLLDTSVPVTEALSRLAAKPS